MREVLKSDGSKAITTGTEPKRNKRPEPEPITTQNVSPLTPMERTARALEARVKAEADRTAAKAEAEKKGGAK